ncbi:MAG: TetR/AcrR family transcriptional regulator [Acetatifactor sp.]|nr:TetR/AcrR family transcriptional regulator [Acetatifactor sp.]
MKRKLQFERTDRDITEAFLRILLEKPFEKITIQDIITEAMINRSTFYQHFPDKYAILENLQKKYVTELTDLVNNVRTHDGINLKQIDQIMGSYFLKNRQVLCILFHTKTEHVDILKQFRILFADYFRRSSSQLTELEAYLMSGNFLDFFVYYLEHDIEPENYSSLLFESYYNITIHFFRMEQNPEAQKAFLDLIAAYAKK